MSSKIGAWSLPNGGSTRKLFMVKLEEDITTSGEVPLMGPDTVEPHAT